ncbi:LOW QUALITY PROTEIN: hypothetical protein PHMEG_00019499 [Phytophthora megakarya]|uniref:Uncharacterized protein n=1 Tax=Phytophthora megakarya TaxID=4795 RepID=A0A225VRG3_9STRA|nr:LOW QUALITY PROTEIN: hypothetical protein PHMEG_00019499 [Phytophthora megakarya]
MDKCPMEEFYNTIREWFNPTKHMGMLPEASEKMINYDARRGGIRYEPSTSVDQVSKQRDLPDNTRDLHGNHTFAISSLRHADEYARSDVTMTVDLHPGESRVGSRNIDDLGSAPTLDLLPGESRGYWNHHAPGKWFRQAKIVGKIHNEKPILLLDIGAEVSIVDTAFARKVGCYIDSSQIQDCVWIGDNVYRTKEIKVTLAGSLVYFFDIWVGDLSGQEAILGMDFMVPAGIRLDLAHGSTSLPDEVRIQLSGRRQLYSGKARIVNLGQYLRIRPGNSAELSLRLRTSDHEKFWVTRGDHWVPTVVHGPGKIQYMKITNVGDKVLILHQDLRIGIWLAGDNVSRDCQVSSQWGPGAIWIRNSARNPATTKTDGDEKKGEDTGAVLEDQPDTLDLDLTWDSDQDYDECLYYHEGSDLYVEDVDGQLAVLPEVPVTTEDVTIEDIQLRGSDRQMPEEIDRLRQRIWKFRHRLIGKENTPPPAARGVVCDIDVGGARPIALKCRKLRIQFREKLAELIKGLLSAKMINHSRSPWASPIVVIIKKNSVDIRLCIDYRLVNSLTQLMVYPMPLTNGLREYLESTLWYCSLDMADDGSGRLISAFITPFELFEWNRMPFGLKNAPQIYQRMLDNALYGFTRIPKMAGDLENLDVFEAGEPEDRTNHRFYIDDILVPANNWDQLCDQVEGLLEACDKWNLSIIVVKSFWGIPKVEYLGHKVSHDGLETNPKDLSALTDLEFPGCLLAMQSFLDSLNFYSRFIEDYAIYASVLYELREIDYAAMEKGMNRSRIQLALASESPDPDILTKDPASPQPSDPSLQGPDPELSDQDPNLASRDPMPDCVKTLNPETDDSVDLDPRWIHAHRSFEVLKEKIAKTPILRHFDPDRRAVVVVYASDWAISGALMQEYDQVYYPVMFASRTLKSNELNYGIAEKEVLALLRILDLNYNTLTDPSADTTFHTGLAIQIQCTTRSPGTVGRATFTLDPRDLRSDKDLYVTSFDGSARVKRGEGAYSAILWKLPECTVDLTINEAEYHGLLLCLDLLEGTDPLRLVICGDSNLVIHQVRGEIDCKAPGLTLLRQKALDRLRIRPDHELVHVKRDWNGSADSLASAALQRQCGIKVETDNEIQDLITLNRLDEILVVKSEDPAVPISAVTTRSKTRSGVRSGSNPPVLCEEVTRELRIERIRQAHDCGKARSKSRERSSLGCQIARKRRTR